MNQQVRKLRAPGWLAALALGFALCAGAQAESIRFLVTEYSQKTGPFFEEAAAAFAQENPSASVDVEVVSWDTVQQRLITDLSAGNPPDISIIGTRWLLDFVGEGAAENLDPYMDDAFRSRFIPTFFSPGILDGKTYGLPVAASARAMFYNKDLLQRAGYSDPPQTWAELEEMAGKISALDGNVHGFGLQGKEIETDVYFYYAMWSHGGSILDDSGESGVASPAAVRAASLYKRLIDAGATQPGVTDYSREDVQNLFIDGRLGFVFSLPFLPNQIAEKNPGLNFGVAPIPRETRRHTYGVTDSIVMFNASRNKDVAWKFLEFVFRDEWRRKFTVNEGFLPVNVAVSGDPHFADDQNLKVFAAMLPEAKFAPTILGWEEIAQITSDALQEIYLGNETPESGLGKARDRINRVLR